MGDTPTEDLPTGEHPRGAAHRPPLHRSHLQWQLQPVSPSPQEPLLGRLPACSPRLPVSRTCTCDMMLSGSTPHRRDRHRHAVTQHTRPRSQTESTPRIPLSPPRWAPTRSPQPPSPLPFSPRQVTECLLPAPAWEAYTLTGAETSQKARKESDVVMEEQSRGTAKHTRWGGRLLGAWRVWRRPRHCPAHGDPPHPGCH